MPDPVPPAPNPTPEPTPSIRGYVNAWELAKIVLGTLATGGISSEVAMPLLRRLAEGVNLWVAIPEYREPVQVLIGAVITVLSGFMMTRHYLRKGDDIETVAKPATKARPNQDDESVHVYGI